MSRSQHLTAAECARCWEVEAARDGRLSGDAREALERHIGQCAACRERAEGIEGLGRALRELPELQVDEVAMRRLRHDVLARVDAEVSGRTSRGRFRRASLALGMAAVLVLVVMLARDLMHARLAGLPTTRVDARDEGGARWSQRAEGDVERVELADGTLRLSVKKTPGGRRVVVRVPDGEIEDVGTIFHVVVSHGRTERVGVDEGRVTIRFVDAAPFVISSGQIWERPADVPAMPTVQTTALPAASSTHARPFPTVEAARKKDAAADSSVDAEEDAAYLHVVRLLRGGREDAAKKAAREYLRRFPDGFRRAEITRIAE